MSDRMQEGRGSGLDAAFAAERAGLERYVRRLGATPAEAEDVVATAFLRAVESGQQVSDSAALAAWLRVVARNEWIDAQRRRMRRRAAADRETAEGALAAPSAAQQAEVEEDTRELLAAIAELPPAQRAAL